MQIQIFSEIGYGNNSFCSTEIEKGKYEHRVKGFVIPPKIEGFYIRIWIWKKVFVLSSKNGISLNSKERARVKVLFGLEGMRR
jgi:hypothetical protein